MNLENHYKLTILNINGETYSSSSPFGNGNCAFYAFLCGCIESITSNTLNINDKDFTDFIETVKSQLKLVTIPQLEDELQSDFNQFNKFIQQPGLTFSKFKNYLIESPLTRSKLAAINLIFGPGLRFRAATNYYEVCSKELGVPKEELPEEDRNFFEDQQWVTTAVLHALAEKYKLPVKFLSEIRENDDPSAKARYFKESAGDPSQVPLFTLLLKGNESDRHWYHIEQLTPSENIKELRKICEELRKICAEIPHTTTLNQFSKTLNTLSYLLEKIYDNETNEKELLWIGEEAKLAAQISLKIVNEWRDNNLKNDGSGFNTQGLHIIQQELIEKSFKMDDSVDAAIAAILQAIELLKFKEFIDKKDATSAQTPSLSSNPSALHKSCSQGVPTPCTFSPTVYVK